MNVLLWENPRDSAANLSPAYLVQRVWEAQDALLVMKTQTGVPAFWPFLRTRVSHCLLPRTPLLCGSELKPSELSLDPQPWQLSKNLPATPVHAMMVPIHSALRSFKCKLHCLSSPIKKKRHSFLQPRLVHCVP